MTPPQPPDWIGPVCHACSRLLPRGAPLSREHVGARQELVANDPKWASRTVRIDGIPMPGVYEVAPGWRRGDTLVVRCAFNQPCRCAKAPSGFVYALIESGRVVVA